MEHKLDVRRYEDGIAFYIDGSLQFDTRDEHIYHESLVLPAALLASRRAKTSLTGLILGGGDGLSMRELLKVAPIAKAKLVDHDPGVLELARTEFARYNKNAFSDKRVSVETRDAIEHLKRSDSIFDVIIADFTYPESLGGCELFTSNFFSLIKKRLSSNGFFGINAVSPSISPAAFWSIYKTLKSLKINPKPLRAEIPSFSSRGYGEWGFLFGSKSPVSQDELLNVRFPDDARYLSLKKFLENMKFPRYQVSMGLALGRAIRYPSDLLGLLNMSGQEYGTSADTVDFSRSKALRFAYPDSSSYIMTSDIMLEWAGKVQALLKELDWELFTKEADRVLKDMPGKIREEFRALKTELPDMLKENILSFRNVYKCFSTFLILVIFLNLVYPDNAFAKGYHSGNSSGDGNTELVLFSNAVNNAFHGRAFQADDISEFLPNIKGQSNDVRRRVFDVMYEGSVKREKLFYALTDDIYLTELGKIFIYIKGIPYIFKIGKDGISCYSDDNPELIFETNHDESALGLLKDNLALQTSALRKVLSDYEKWINWAGTGKYISTEMKLEEKELKNLKAIQSALRLAEAELAGFVIGSVKPAQPTIKLVPGVFLSESGSIIFRKRDGTWAGYSYPGFPESTLPDKEPKSSQKDKFIEVVLKYCASKLPNTHQISKFILSCMEKGRDSQNTY